MKISKKGAIKIGIIPSKNRKSPHFADIARIAGKQQTQLKAWVKIIKTGQ